LADQDPAPDAEAPVLDLLAAMTAASLERSSPDPQTLLLMRLAAPVAADADADEVPARGA
jgi:hypothetical protein